MEVKSFAEKMFFNTVKITTKTAAGAEGSGTGFFFQVEQDGEVWPFIVTNKHVVEGSHTGTLTFHVNDNGKPVLGRSTSLSIDPASWGDIWLGHPDPNVDITVCPLGPIVNALKDNGLTPFYCLVSKNQIPSAAELEKLDALEEITFVGYPNGIWDQLNFLPVMRRGTTATPLQVDFEGTPRFLIDASVFGGSSGSPVYIIRTGIYADKLGNMTTENRIYFVGVVAAVYYRTHLNEIISVPIPTAVKPMASQQEMLDLGVVFKASTVVEAIENFIEQRIKPTLVKK